MKIYDNQIEAWLKNPSNKPKNIKALLLFGPNAGLAADYADRLIKHLAPGDAELHVLTQEQVLADPAALRDSLCTQSLFGGGAGLVRVNDVSEKLTKHVSELLDDFPNGGHFLILVAGDLESPKKSKLRQLCEPHDAVATLGCYAAKPEELKPWIVAELKNHGCIIAPDALVALSERMPPDRGAQRLELDKLALYVEKTKNISLADVLAATGDAADADIFALVEAVALRDAKTALKLNDRLAAEGTSPIALLRITLNQLWRLYTAARAIEGGANTETALRSLAPPVFGWQEKIFLNQLKRWNASELGRALARLTDLEANLKTTGALEAAWPQLVLAMGAR